MFSDPSTGRKASALLIRALTCSGAPGPSPASTSCLWGETGLMSENSKIGFPRAPGPLRAAKSRLSAVLRVTTCSPQRHLRPPGPGDVRPAAAVAAVKVKLSYRSF